jgi:ADP-dependent phosphofructokinase/glucokinase
MKFPVEIRIRGHNYRIEYVESQREVEVDFESDAFIGTVDDNAIRVFVTKSLLTMVDTLIHEVLHAIFTRNKMLKTAFRPDMEESFITTLAGEIALILFDNELVKFPTKGPPITTRIVPESD